MIRPGLVLAGVLALAAWLSSPSRSTAPAARPAGTSTLAPARTDTVLHVPASGGTGEPVFYPRPLAQGERLALEIEGTVDGLGPDSADGMPAGALVASFDGGPPFLMSMGSRARKDGRPAIAHRLVWTAPAAGTLAFAVAQEEGRRLGGGYRVNVIEIGVLGDPRQAGFPRPWIRFASRSPEGDFLELTYSDRSGYGLDRGTLKVFLDTERGERFVLTPYFTADSRGAVLAALPGDVDLPAGVHKVTATIGDMLGNVSPPAVVFVDRP